MNLDEVFQSQRREQATDARGLPASYARAMKAFEGTCAHCSQRAVVATGAGVGLCQHHRREHASGRDAANRWRERVRQQIDAMKREL